VFLTTSLLLLSLQRTVNDSVFDFFYVMANYLENNNDDIFEDDFDILKIISEIPYLQDYLILSISILLMNKVFIRDSGKYP
jgi:hypothetical protein